MKLLSVLLARYFAFLEAGDLNPRGHAHFPDIVQALVERYQFSEYPKAPADFDEKKGVAFKGGRDGKVSIVQFQVFDQVMYLDTGSSTADSERIFYETLEWVSRQFGLSYSRQMVKRNVYVSSITFSSDKMLDALNPGVNLIAKKLSQRVPEYLGHPLDFSVSNLSVGYDPSLIKTGPAVFTIERRAGKLFSENTYFSNAPLPTDEHIELIQELEKNL